MKTKPTTATIQTENPTATTPAQDPTVRTEQPSLNDESVFHGKSKSNAQANSHGTAHDLMYLPCLPPEIMAARIAFALKMDLVKRVHPQVADPPHHPGEEWHQPEAFRDRRGRIVQIVHNYCSPPPKIMNMVPVGTLYREDMTSYAGRYAGSTEHRVRLEAAAVRGDKFSAACHLFAEPPTPRRKRGGRPTKAKA